MNGSYSRLDKADMFALGATAYELVRGVALPGEGPQYRALRQGQISLLPSCSVPFQNALKALMHEDPEQRPSAEQLLRMPALQRVGQ